MYPLPLSPAYPPAGTAWVQRPIHPCSTGHIVIAWVLTVLSLGYFLPWAIAATRHHTGVAGVALLNLFLGWTGLGWLGSLIWACLGIHTHPMLVATPTTIPGQVAPSPYGLPALPPPPAPGGPSSGVIPSYDKAREWRQP